MVDEAPKQDPESNDQELIEQPPCPRCNGSGLNDKRSRFCSACRGSGKQTKHPYGWQ